MQFFKKNIWSLSCMALFMVMAFAGSASAQLSGSSVMDIATTKAENVFKSVKTIMFIVGGFGLVALAFFAIFGKIKWTWFASLAVGLAILAAAGAIIDYSTGSGTSESMGDSFGDSVNYN